MSKEKVEVIFQPVGKRTAVKQDTTIMEAVKSYGIDLSTICGGKGTCGKCKVRIDSGREFLEELTPGELKHLSNDEIEAGYRLACLTKLRGKTIVTIPERSRVGKQRLQTEGLDVPLLPNPFVKKYFIKMSRATLEDDKPDDIRIYDAIKEQHGIENLEIDHGVTLNLPIVLRKGNWAVTVVVWDGRKIIAVEIGDTSERCFGLAVDIGSTKLAGFLLNLTQGKVVALSARMNPQIPYGEDVMSRISYSMEGAENLQRLSDAVVGGINEIIEECCQKGNVKPNEIYESVFVGNTCMHHLFLGINPRHIGLSPYVPSISTGINVEAKKLNLNLLKNGNVFTVGTMGGFVGADTVAGILVADMLDSDEITFLIDIGTNTEIALGNRDKIMACSCASGPAFEGMQVKNGMRAATGAIEKISIDPKTLEINYRTIDDVKPVGICGSGLIDAPAEMLKAGIIDNKGRFQKEIMEKTDRLKIIDNETFFVIAPKDETSIDSDIVVTQRDIRELLLAKAAMYTGGAILMKRMGISLDKIDQLIMAGAFGNYIDPESARLLGMYPEVPVDKIKFVGNSAGTGARMVLISKEARKRSDEIARKVHYFELAIDPDFQLEYAKAGFIPHMETDRFPIAKELLTRLGQIKK